MPDDARHALRESLLVYALVSALTWLLGRASGLPPLREHLHLAVGALFLLAAIKSAERLPGGLARYGLSLGGLLTPGPDEPTPGVGGALRDLTQALIRAAPSCLRETGVALLVCAVCFPPFVAGFYLWHTPARPFTLDLPPDTVGFLLTQLMVVGLPEEALFRGYLQHRLQEAFPGRTRVLGASVSLAALLLQAALFALLHYLMDLHPVRLAVFFPALLFGWVTALRSGIGAAIVVHALSNWLSEVLVRGFL